MFEGSSGLGVYALGVRIGGVKRYQQLTESRELRGFRSHGAQKVGFAGSRLED